MIQKSFSINLANPYQWKRHQLRKNVALVYKTASGLNESTIRDLFLLIKVFHAAFNFSRGQTLYEWPATVKDSNLSRIVPLDCCSCIKR